MKAGLASYGYFLVVPSIFLLDYDYLFSWEILFILLLRIWNIKSFFFSTICCHSERWVFHGAKERGLNGRSTVDVEGAKRWFHDFTATLSVTTCTQHLLVVSLSSRSISALVLPQQCCFKRFLTAVQLPLHSTSFRTNVSCSHARSRSSTSADWHRWTEKATASASCRNHHRIPVGYIVQSSIRII